MQRFLRVPPALALLLGPASLVGCGDDNSVSEVKPSQAAIDADEAGRKAMREYMEGKTKSKTKSAPGGNAPPR